MRIIECQHCGAQIQTRAHNRKYCSQCRRIVTKELQKRWVRENHERRLEKERVRLADPEKREKRRHQWREFARRKLAAERDVINERRRKRRAENPDKYRERNRAWAAANPEKKLECYRKWTAQNRHKCRGYEKKWRLTHPEIKLAQTRRYRARKKGALGSHTLEEFYAVCEYFGWRCAYCGCQLDKETATEDHVVPLARGGSDDISNIVPACHSCNSRKQDRLPEEFIGCGPYQEVVNRAGGQAPASNNNSAENHHPGHLRRRG